MHEAPERPRFDVLAKRDECRGLMPREEEQHSSAKWSRLAGTNAGTNNALQLARGE